MKQYPVKGEKIIYQNDSEFTGRLVRKWGYSRWRANLIGGYTLLPSKEIFIREKRRGDEVLLAHERGHLLGFEHTLFPTIMFCSWVGRIFKTYYPYKRK